MIISLFSKKKLNAIFFGTPDFAIPSLKASLDLFHVKAVVSQPDRPRGRGHKILPCPVKEFALQHKISVFSPESLKKESKELNELKCFIEKNSIDLFVVLAYGNLLPTWTLEAPKVGCVNLHASLLPRWRGAAPIQRAIEAGDNSTGVSLQRMVLKLDAGDVLHEKRILIDPHDNSETLSNKLSELSAEVLKEYFTKQFKKTLDGLVQEEALVTYAEKITKDEAIWAPHWRATETHNKVRAFYSWPQVKLHLSSGEIIALTKTTLDSHYKGEPLAPGQLLIKDGRVFLGCASSESLEPALEVLNIKPANRGEVRAWDYLQNHAARDSLTLT